MVDDLFATVLLLAGVAAILWIPVRNVRAALRNPPSRDATQGALLGLLIGFWLS